AAEVGAYFKGGCIEHEDVLERLPQPSRERLLPVGPPPELGHLRDAYCSIRRRVALVARFDNPLVLLDLVLAGFDREPCDIVALGQRSQLVETDGLVGARRIGRVVADRKIPQSHPLGFGWYQRITRGKDSLVGLKDVAKLGAIVL